MNKSQLHQAIYDLETQYVNYDGFRTVTEKMNDVLSLYRATGYVKNLCIVGESGTGKTSAAELLKQSNPDAELTELSVRTIVYVEVPSVGTVSALAYQILAALGDPYPSKGLIPERTRRIQILLKACKTEMMLLDEAQHVYDRGQRKSHYATSDWLKGLLDAIGIPLILLGISRLEMLLDVNEQLRRRFESPINLTNRAYSEIESETYEIVKLLAPSMIIPLSADDLRGNDAAARFYFATDGRVAYIKKLLIAAMEVAFDSGESVVYLSTIERAFSEKIWSAGVDKLNPFSPDFVFRRLDNVGEPFCQDRVI